MAVSESSHPFSSSVPVSPHDMSAATYTDHSIAGLVSNLGFGQRTFIQVTTLAKGGLKEEAKGGQGAWNTCWATTGKKSTDGKDVMNGALYFPVGKPVKLAREGSNTKLAERLYEWTEKELASWNWSLLSVSGLVLRRVCFWDRSQIWKPFILLKYYLCD